MLFRKDIEPCCAYCTRGQPIDETQMICVKRGVVSAEDCCASFRYDPLKRIPPRPQELDAGKYSQEDFTL